MPKEEGLVKEVSRKKAVIQIERSSACAHCKERAKCEIVSSGKEVLVEVGNDLNAAVGDRVEISMPAGSLLKLSLLVYFFPIGALLIGAYAGALIAGAFHAQSTPGAVVGGGLAFGITFYVLKWIDRGGKISDKYQPKMTRILFSEALSPSPVDNR